ncbi:MAG: FAD-binding protein, partial [Pseudomonadota bacterium]
MSDRDIAGAIDALNAHFGERASSGQSQREQHTHTTTWIAPELPDLVVFAESADDVETAVTICAQHRCPIIPFGVGTSLEGHLNAPEGGVSIDLSRMDQVLSVNAEDLSVTVQPGITREALNTALRDTGLFFPIDPGANASSGGMTATRASGTNAVRYGTMRDNVMALEVVNAKGQRVRTGTRAKKSSAGYDLTHLMVGSEGTLGIATEITLRLQGIPEKIVAGSATFPSIDAACKTVIDTIQLGLPVARIELLDPVQVRASNQYSGLSLPEAPLLLLEFHGSEATVGEQITQFKELAGDHGCNQLDTAGSLEERNKLWQARH